MCSSRKRPAQPRARSGALAALAAAAVLAACAEPERAPADGAAANGAAAGIEERVEPVAQAGAVEAGRYTSPPSFPLPFTTVLPPGVRVETEPAGEPASITFAPVDGAPGAMVHIFVPPSGTSEQAARALVRNAAERFQIPGTDAELQPARIHPWAVEEYTKVTRGRVRDQLGWMALGRRQGRWFLLLVQIPIPVAQSFGPRSEQIVDEWRWTDGEEPRQLTQ